jgi:2-succinyl-5-enolpyruvyl-6-hydroxy-3-cyclohexene-1-carboxylate synthase
MTRIDPIAELNARHGHGLAGALVAAGVRDVVLSPGSRSTPLVLGFAENDQARCHVVVDERVAGFVALGMARAGDRPVALVCTSGSAGAHWLPAVIEAFHSRVPLILLTADRPPELHEVGAPQSVAQTRLFGDFVRWSFDLGTPEASQPDRWLRTIATRAVVGATRGPAGPVHLNVPLREPLWAPGVRSPRHRSDAVQWVAAGRVPEPALTAAIASQLGERRRGVIVCGCLPPKVGQALAGPLSDLAWKLGWPILAEPTSQLRFGSHQLGPVIGTADALLRDERFRDAHVPDVVLRFGQAPLSKPLRAWLERRATDRSVLIDADSEWHDPDLTADALLGVEPVALARALADAVPDEPADPGWLRRWRAADDAATGALSAACDEAFWEGTVARDVARSLPANGALHVAASMPVRDLDSFASINAASRRVFANRGANGIDGLIATAAGEAIALDEPVTVLLGDLALQHDVGGLIAAAGLGVSLTVVVINNGGGRIFEHLPIADHPTAFERYFVTPQALDIEALAAACNARWRRVGAAESLADALKAGQGEAGVSLVEAVIDPQDNLARHDAAWRDVRRALAKLLEEAA